jgi:hypothetical protein
VLADVSVEVAATAYNEPAPVIVTGNEDFAWQKSDPAAVVMSN